MREEENVRAFQDKMLVLMQKMQEIVELIEFENEDLWRVFDDIIANELFDVQNLE